jgi:hypothetical protein
MPPPLPGAVFLLAFFENGIIFHFFGNFFYFTLEKEKLRGYIIPTQKKERV